MKLLKYKLFFLIFSILPSLQAQALTIDFSAISPSLSVGENLDILINAKDFDLDAFDELAGGVTGFSISSPNTISINHVTVAPHWDFIPTSGMLEGNTWKGINFEAFSNDPLISDGLIATINITGLKAGKTTLTLLSDSDFFSSTDPLITSQIINPAGFEVTVQAVPVPAAFWLMSTALIGLAWGRQNLVQNKYTS